MFVAQTVFFFFPELLSAILVGVLLQLTICQLSATIKSKNLWFYMLFSGAAGWLHDFCCSLVTLRFCCSVGHFAICEGLHLRWIVSLLTCDSNQFFCQLFDIVGLFLNLIMLLSIFFSILLCVGPIVLLSDSQ